MNRIIVLLALISLGIISTSWTNTDIQDPKEIVRKSDEKLRGNSSKGELKMTIIRPKWTREITIKSWSKGDDFALMYVTSPARDRGVVFLKREKEIWNWQPSIERMIKLPPSMMMQSWMGSDFKNDDIVKQSSIVDDFTHQLTGSEIIESRDCYIIEMIPKEEAAVVWGKVISWIDKEEFMQLKHEFYDEDGYLIHTMYGKGVKNLGGKLLPSILEVIPADEEGNKTVVEHLSLNFDIPIDNDFFSVQNAKRVKP